MTQLSIKHLKTKRGDVTHSLLMLSNRCQILCLPVVNVCRSQGKRDWGTTLIPLAFYRSSKESDTNTHRQQQCKKWSPSENETQEHSGLF